jgi:DNA-binding HxlR family transcriptional regulator
MKRADNKSHCPINFALEVFGDPWSLLIIRDIVYFGKKTYGEFLDSEERMATNMLACRLLWLEEKDILVKRPHPTDRRKEIYELTERGLDTIPILVELALWGAHYDVDTQAPSSWITMLKANRDKILPLVRQTVQNGGAIFAGPNSVVSQLYDRN